MSLIFKRAPSHSKAWASASGRCVDCVHFRNDTAAIERSFPGLSAMGSAAADVRAYDGLCGKHGLYLAFCDGCPQFEPAGAAAARLGRG